MWWGWWGEGGCRRRRHWLHRHLPPHQQRTRPTHHPPTLTHTHTQWKEARDAYVARSSDSEVARPLSPRSKAARLAASKSLDL